MKPLPLLAVVASAALALSSPLSGQALEPPPFSVHAPAPGPDTTLALELRVEEARQSYRHNRLLGNGLIVAGAAFVVGAMVDWAARDQLGMRPGATSVMVGGMSLVAWGADRRGIAGEALRRAEAWEAQIRSAPGQR